MNRKPMTIGAVSMLVAACGQGGTRSYPAESWVRPPVAAPTSTDRVFGRDQMIHFYDAPGEYGYALQGSDAGFASLSFITTDTEPGGGPPLHTHDTEEAHVLLDGRYRVLLDGRPYDVTGPAIVRIPAGVPHTFLNTSDRVIHIIGILASDTITYTEVGPNPLLTGAKGDGEGESPPESASSP